MPLAIATRVKETEGIAASSEFTEGKIGHCALAPRVPERSYQTRILSVVEATEGVNKPQIVSPVRSRVQQCEDDQGRKRPKQPLRGGKRRCGAAEGDK